MRTATALARTTRALARCALLVSLVAVSSVPGVLAADPPSAPTLVELKVGEGDILNVLFRFTGTAPADTYGVRLNIYVQDTLASIGTSIPYQPAGFNYAIKQYTTPVSSFGYGSTADMRYCIGLKTFVGDGTNERSVFSGESSRQCVGTQRVLIPTQSTGPCPFAACDPRSTTDAVANTDVVRVADLIELMPNLPDVVAPTAPQPVAPQLELQSANIAAVKVLQRLLNVHNADVVVDGDFGPQTEQAVKDFQSDEKLASDGIVGPRTWEALFVTVRRNDSGDAVRIVQDLLKSQGLDPDTNGRFDQKTEAAVRKFQDDKSLQVDGIVGPRTWNALVAAL